MTPRRTTMYCHRAADVAPWLNFADHPMITRLYDSERQVFEVTVVECQEQPGCYWAWWDKQRRKFLWCFPERGLVEMVFPYGSAPEEENDRGKLLPVLIKNPRPVRAAGA